MFQIRLLQREKLLHVMFCNYFQTLHAACINYKCELKTRAQNYFTHLF